MLLFGEVVIVCCDEILQGRAKSLPIRLTEMWMGKEVPARCDGCVDVTIPLRAGIVLEREPAELGLLSTLAFGVTARYTEETEVFETKYRKLAVNLLFIDMFVLDEVSKYPPLVLGSRCQVPSRDVAR